MFLLIFRTHYLSSNNSLSIEQEAVYSPESEQEIGRIYYFEYDHKLLKWYEMESAEMEIDGHKVLLFSFDVTVGIILCLQLQESADGISNLNQALDTVFRRRGCFNGNHSAVLSEIDFAVIKSVGEVPDSRIGRNGIIFFL